jgi:acyl carrier protein
MATDLSIEERIYESLGETINPQMDLDAAGFDSLEQQNLFVDLEIPDADSVSLRTVEQIADYLRRRKAS